MKNPFRRKRPTWPQIPHDEIVKRSKVLVIDDQEFTYGKLFTRDGYSIEKWRDVKNLSDLETDNFDLILLDLMGVGRKESSEEGLGLLKHLREACPAQLVVAYSNAEFSLKDHQFFNLADAVLAKTADYAEFKRTVDKLLDQRFSLGFYVERIQRELGDYANELPRLPEKATESILSGKMDGLREYLKRVEDSQLIDRSIRIAQVATMILKIWNA